MATLAQPKHLRKQTQNHSQFSHRITKMYKLSVVPQNLPLHFSSRNHSFRHFPIFQTGSRIGQTDFSRQSDRIRVFIGFHGSRKIQTVCLGFWLILAQLWSGERFFGIWSGIRVCTQFSQKDLILQCFSSYSEIWTEAFGLSSHCVTKSVKRCIWIEFAVFV